MRPCASAMASRRHAETPLAECPSHHRCMPTACPKRAGRAGRIQAWTSPRFAPITPAPAWIVMMWRRIRSRSSGLDAGRAGRAGPRSHRDDALHRRCGRPPLLANRVAEGLRRARIRLLHQLPEPQRARYRGQPACLAADLLDRARARGAHRRTRGNDERRRVDAYFASRPLGSRISAVASPQSEPVASRDALDALFSAAEARLGEQVERPPYWGGYRVVPNRYEFWQGRRSRRHDRLVYAATADGWRLERLAP